MSLHWFFAMSLDTCRFSGWWCLYKMILIENGMYHSEISDTKLFQHVECRKILHGDYTFFIRVICIRIRMMHSESCPLDRSIRQAPSQNEILQNISIRHGIIRLSVSGVSEIDRIRPPLHDHSNPGLTVCLVSW